MHCYVFLELFFSLEHGFVASPVCIIRKIDSGGLAELNDLYCRLHTW